MDKITTYAGFRRTMDADRSALPRAFRDTATKGGLAGWHLRAIERLAGTDLANLTVARMAAAADLSPYHFSRAFRVSTGLPPREWLLQKRLAAAKTLLVSTSCTIDQIATSVGYSSGSQFSRAFRARFGASPQEFRRR